MKISKLFHWLYAILMLMPFGLILFNVLSSMWSGNVIDINTWWQYNNAFFSGGDFFDNGVCLTIYGVFDYLCGTVFGLASYSESYVIICNFLTYWTCISIIWLVFDVFMYVPLLVHRWIDKAKIE